MCGDLLEKPDLTAGSEHQRDTPAIAVNFKFRRYWSGNTVYDENGQNPVFELRFCPFCMANIEHDHRGHPYCLECGSIFPLPLRREPQSAEKLKNHKAAFMRRFLRENGWRIDGFRRDAKTKPAPVHRSGAVPPLSRRERISRALAESI